MCSGVIETTTPVVTRMNVFRIPLPVLSLVTSSVPSFGGRYTLIKRFWLTLFLWIPCSALLAEQYSDDQATRSNARQIADWSVATSDIPMSDGSLLREYLASSADIAGSSPLDTPINSTGTQVEDGSTSTLEFVFHPRFLCSPLIRVVRSYSSKGGDREFSGGDNAIALEIDNEPVGFPALVEQSEHATLYFYNVNLQRRATLRVLVELGSEISIIYSDGETATISLRGSQKALETASADCLKH